MYLGTTDIFEILSSIIALLIAIRAFWLFAQVRGYRLLILGLAMILFAVSTFAGITRNVHFIPHSFTTTWYSFAGQTLALIFLFLSSLRGTDSYLRSLMRWQILLSVLVTVLLPLSPSLPPVTDVLTKALFLVIRALICFFAFYSYLSLFMKKETRFSFFMAAAFLALTFGYGALIPRFFLPQADLLIIVGDILRIIGLLFLALGFLGG